MAILGLLCLTGVDPPGRAFERGLDKTVELDVVLVDLGHFILGPPASSVDTMALLCLGMMMGWRPMRSWSKLA